MVMAMRTLWLLDIKKRPAKIRCFFCMMHNRQQEINKMSSATENASMIIMWKNSEFIFLSPQVGNKFLAAHVLHVFKVLLIVIQQEVVVSWRFPVSKCSQVINSCLPFLVWHPRSEFHIYQSTFALWLLCIGNSSAQMYQWTSYELDASSHLLSSLLIWRHALSSRRTKRRRELTMMMVSSDTAWLNRRAHWQDESLKMTTITNLMSPPLEACNLLILFLHWCLIYLIAGKNRAAGSVTALCSPHHPFLVAVVHAAV